jgi:DNA-binding CsgD family transcriptional regulator
MCGRLGESKELLRTLLDPGSECRHEALELLAATERLLGRLPQARRMLLGELARADDGLDEASIRLELAATEVLGGHLGDAERNAKAVLSLVDGGAHPEVVAAADTLLALIRVLGGDRAEAGAQLARAQWVVDGLDDVALRGMLDLIAPLAWVELMTERYDDAIRHLDRGITVARRYGRNHVMPDLYLVRSITSGRAGKIDAALRDAEDAEEMALLVGGLELRWLAAVMRLRPLLWRTGPAEARVLLDQVRVSQPLRSPWWRTAAATTTAEVALDLGDIDLCRSVLRDKVGSDAPTSGTVAELRLLARADLLSGDLVGARALFEQADIAGQDSGLRGELAALALIEAELLSAEGKVVDAIDAALRAALDARGAGMPVREGQARVVLGELHHRAGDLPASRVEFGRARDLFSDAGADWLVSQVGSAIRRLPAGRPRTRPRPLGAQTLSAREREVAVMVTEGLTNRAIADRLFLSPRTVEAHLARIFAKFGVSTRAALVQVMGVSPASES